MELTLVVGHTYPYGFGFDSLVPIEVREWCLVTYATDRCHVRLDGGNLVFDSEADYLMFLLRWA
jgi:hypothetical protein